VNKSDVDSWRRRISQKVEDVQGLIESSKFELRDFKLSEIQKLTGDAQIIFVLLLSLARQRYEVTHSNVVQAAVVELDNAIATALLALETYVASGSQPLVPNLEGMMYALERYVAASTNAIGVTGTDLHLTESLALYRALVVAIKRFFSEPMNTVYDGHEVRGLAVQ
jgi:hypothetical protein